MAIGPALSFATTILSYFSPSKSPFYSVVAFGTIALILSCAEIAQVRWPPVAIPVFLVLALSAVLSFKSRPNFDAGQGEEQLRFARSFSISSALLAFVVTARSVDEIDSMFWLSYFACLSQIVVFLAYTWARSQTQEEQSAINFVQFALITGTFLIGASYASVQYAIFVPEDSPAYFRNQYFVVAWMLYFLWLCCMLYWLYHLSRLIKVDIPRAGE